MFVSSSDARSLINDLIDTEFDPIKYANLFSDFLVEGLSSDTLGL